MNSLAHGRIVGGRSAGAGGSGLLAPYYAERPPDHYTRPRSGRAENLAPRRLLVFASLPGFGL